MIFDTDPRPKGVTLVRLSKAGTAPQMPLQLSDLFPLWPAGTSDARQWRPDATMSQNWAFENEKHTSPISAGATATNHVSRKPTRLQFECIITDTPSVPVSFGALPGGVRRSESLLAGLLELRDSRSFVAVLSPTRIIETAVVLSVGVPRTPTDGNGYRVQITIEEAQVFSLQYLESVDDIPARLGANNQRGGGVVVG